MAGTLPAVHLIYRRRDNNKGYETAADGVIEVSAPALSFAVFAHVK